MDVGRPQTTFMKSKSPKKFIENLDGGNRKLSRFQPGAARISRVKPTIKEKIERAKSR